MVKHLFTQRRRQAPRYPAGLEDNRVPQLIAPQPRMRWY